MANGDLRPCSGDDRQELEERLRSLRSQRAVTEHELYMIDRRIEDTEAALAETEPTP